MVWWDGVADDSAGEVGLVPGSVEGQPAEPEKMTGFGLDAGTVCTFNPALGPGPDPLGDPDDSP